MLSLPTMVGQLFRVVSKLSLDLGNWPVMLLKCECQKPFKLVPVGILKLVPFGVTGCVAETNEFVSLCLSLVTAYFSQATVFWD